MSQNWKISSIHKPTLVSYFIWSADTLMSLISERIDVSQANTMADDEIPLIYINGNWCISRKKGPKIEPCRILASTGVRAFNHLLCSISACSAFFEEKSAIFSTENSKNTCHLEESSILNALNLKKWGIKIYNCALLWEFVALSWLYLTHVLIF